jgi:carbon-monoxide dehydrogenase small subunit
MLVTARDIVSRLPDADEHRVRFELSGNLCRCTGYVGIVRAVCAVLDERRGNSATTGPASRQALGPTGSGHAGPMRAADVAGSTIGAPSAVAASTDEPMRRTTGTAAAGPRPGTVLRQSFIVDHPRERVFAFFAQLDEVVACMPGAALTEAPRDGHVRGRLRIKLGPIAADFAGEAQVERDPARHRGAIRGRGRDSRTNSAASGEVSYGLFEEKARAATRVDIEIGYALTGALAQLPPAIASITSTNDVRASEPAYTSCIVRSDVTGILPFTDRIACRTSCVKLAVPARSLRITNTAADVPSRGAPYILSTSAGQ